MWSAPEPAHDQRAAETTNRNALPQRKTRGDGSQYVLVKTADDYAMLRLDKNNYKLIIAEWRLRLDSRWRLRERTSRSSRGFLPLVHLLGMRG